jgi:hypothetical protein
VDSLSAAAPAAVRTILQKGPMSAGKLRLAWRIVVGAAMDRATSVALADDASVEVTAVDVAWRREVKRSQGEILTRLRYLVGEAALKRIRVLTRPTRP